MGREIPRYQPNAPVPAAPYWPGVNQKDPHFHILPRQSSSDWSSDPGYLHGIDLFNHGCYWEAHEAWEDLWLPLAPEDPLRVFTQGLIQASAALLKIRLNQPRPARSIWSRGRGRLLSIRSGQEDAFYRGIQLDDFCQSIDRLIESENPEFSSPIIHLAKTS